MNPSNRDRSPWGAPCHCPTVYMQCTPKKVQDRNWLRYSTGTIHTKSDGNPYVGHIIFWYLSFISCFGHLENLKFEIKRGIEGIEKICAQQHTNSPLSENLINWLILSELSPVLRVTIKTIWTCGYYHTTDFWAYKYHIYLLETHICWTGFPRWVFPSLARQLYSGCSHIWSWSLNLKPKLWNSHQSLLSQPSPLL